MGCSIPSSYKKLRLSQSTSKLENISQVQVHPSLFISKNPNKFSQIYRPGQSLGKSSSKEVRLCYNRDSNKKSVVKVIKKQENDALNEVKILKQLDHPGIVRLFEYFEDERRVYMVTEHCSGGELFTEILSGKVLHEISIAKIMQQVFSALAYIHERKIVHRNLSPEHIILEDDKSLLNIKIINFNKAIQIQNDCIVGMAGTYYFSAPEMQHSSYSSKCDLWSVGIILCLLLSGDPPYSLVNSKTFHYYGVEERFGFSEENWNKTSEEAKDLLGKLLCEESLRITAKECLNHPWILQKVHHPLCNDNLKLNVLNKLKTFHAFHKLREAVYSFIISQLVTVNETIILREVFRGIDKNGDGKISIDELAEQYSEIMGDKEAWAEATRIMKEVDSDASGFIDYTEFLKVSLDSKKVLSSERLKQAFRMFDKDDSGTINAEELKEVLQGEMQSDDALWKEVILKVDQNQDGEIDLQEFQDIILSNCLKL
jgi:calcium-dependent protein kinase